MDNSPNFDELQSIKDRVKTKFQTLFGIHETIIKAIPDENAEEIEREILDQEEYMFDLQTKILKIRNFRKLGPAAREMLDHHRQVADRTTHLPETDKFEHQGSDLK